MNLILERIFHHHLHPVVADPMEVIDSKCFIVEILSIFNGSVLPLKTKGEFMEIIHHLRIDAIHLVQIGEAVLAEIDVSSGDVVVSLFSETEILHIAEEENTLPFLAH